MNVFEEILFFIVVMTVLFIPIVAISRKKPRNENSRIEELEKRIKELEIKSIERNNEMYEMKKEVNFLQKLLEQNKN